MISGIMRRVIIVAGALVLLFTATFWYISDPDVPRATLEAKYASASSHFVRLPDGARVHVRQRGDHDARALVLIHGSNASLLTWEPWAKRLSDRFRVITLDMPAHGLTGAVPSGDYTQDGMVKFIGEVVDALGLQTFALGGNSMGGRLAALYAAQHSDRVTCLVLVAPGGLPAKRVDPVPLVLRLLRTPVANRILLHITPRSLVVDGLNEAVVHKEIITDEMIDSYWEFARMEGTRKATITRANIRDKIIRDDIGHIKTPTLILWGEEDHVVRVDAASEFHAGISSSTLIVYPKTGHIPQEEIADRSSEDVRTFLSSH
jgi:pimeloyl-ACP methyl ester carboxylesterase